MVNSNVKAVIWDFGGVFSSSPFEAFNHYEEEKGLPKDIIRKINSINPDTNAWALLEPGKRQKHWTLWHSTRKK